MDVHLALRAAWIGKSGLNQPPVVHSTSIIIFVEEIHSFIPSNSLTTPCDHPTQPPTTVAPPTPLRGTRLKSLMNTIAYFVTPPHPALPPFRMPPKKKDAKGASGKADSKKNLKDFLAKSKGGASAKKKVN